MTSALHHRKPESNSNHPADAAQDPVAAHASSAAPADANNHAATKRQALADAFAHGERTGPVRLQGGPYKFREAVEAARHSPLPPLPGHIRRVDKGPFALTPAFAGTVTHDVDLSSDVLNRTPQPGPSLWQRASFGALGTLMAWNLRRQYESVSIFGLGRMRNADHIIDFPGCMVLLPTHTDNPRDGELWPGLYPQMPRISDGQGGSHLAMPHFVMKPAAHWREHLVTDWLFGSHFIHQWSKKDVPGPLTPERDQARRATNARIMAERSAEVKTRGFMSIYPEGRVDGPGIVQPAGGVGAIEAFIDHAGKKIPFVPKGIAYANLGRVDATWSLARAFAAVRSLARQWLGYPQERQPLTMDVPRKPLVNLGRPFVIDTPPDDPQARKAFREQLVRELQHRQAVVHTLTLDGLIGVVAFEAKRIGASLQIDADVLMQFVQRVVYELRLRQNMGFVAWSNEVAVDEDLYNPAKLRDMCNITVSQLRDNGWLDAQGCLVLEKIGHETDMSDPPEPRRLHRHDPLTYWGRRCAQQMQFVEGLRDIVMGRRGLTASPLCCEKKL